MDISDPRLSFPQKNPKNQKGSPMKLKVLIGSSPMHLHTILRVLHRIRLTGILSATEIQIGKHTSLLEKNIKKN